MVFGPRPGRVALRLFRGQAANAWTRTVALFLADKLSESELFAATKTDDGTEGHRVCEAFYYAAMHRLLIEKDLVMAQDFFEQCVATQITNFNEYRFAQDELERMPEVPAPPKSMRERVSGRAVR